MDKINVIKGFEEDILLILANYSDKELDVIERFNNDLAKVIKEKNERRKNG